MSGNLMFGVLLGSLVAAPAFAADDDGAVDEAADVRRDPPPQPVITPLPPQPFDASDLPIPTLEIERLPARTSYEFAMQFSFGPVAYFEDVSAMSPGFGMRAGWGKNVGRNHRFGVAGSASIEGEPGIHTLLTFEPGVAWDFVGNTGLALGVGGGPSFIHTRDNATILLEANSAIDWYAAARVGYSQTFSSVGRRLFFFLEPKVRMTELGPVPTASFVVGSGAGR